MRKKVCGYGQVPANWLVDGGYPGHGQVDAVADETTVYAPVPKAKNPEIGIHQPKPKDSPAVAQWRQRMRSDEAKIIYKERASTAECVNALARNRGLNRLLVRGLQHVKAVALLFALAHNLMRTAPRPQQSVFGSMAQWERRYGGNGP